MKILNDNNYIKLNIKSYGEESGKRIVEGYAAMYGVDRSYPLVVLTKEAMSSAEEDLRINSTVFLNHNYDKPIGKILESQVDDTGLWVKLQLSETATVTTANDMWTMINEGILNSFSIGFRVLDYTTYYDENEETDVYLVKRAEIYEVSLVGLPANKRAKVTSYYIEKSLFQNGEDGGIKMVRNEESGEIKADAVDSVATEEVKEESAAEAVESAETAVEDASEEAPEATTEETVEESTDETAEADADAETTEESDAEPEVGVSEESKPEEAAEEVAESDDDSEATEDAAETSEAEESDADNDAVEDDDVEDEAGEEKSVDSSDESVVENKSESVTETKAMSSELDVKGIVSPMLDELKDMIKSMATPKIEDIKKAVADALVDVLSELPSKEVFRKSLLSAQKALKDEDDFQKKSVEERLKIKLSQKYSSEEE